MHQGIASGHSSKRPAHSTSKDEAKNGTRGWHAVLIHRPTQSPLPRVARRVRRRPAAYRPQGLSIPGRRQFPGKSYIPRRFPQLISSAPAHRLIRPTDRRSIRTGKQDGGRSSARHRITAPSRLRPVSSLVSAGGAKSVSLLSAGSVSGPRCPRPRSGARHRRRLGPAVITASKQVRAARPRSAPRIGRARSHRPTPLVVPSSARRASKQDGGGLVSSARLGPVPPIVSVPSRPSCRSRGSPSTRRSIDGKGKQNAPLPLSRNGAKSVQPLYRTRLL